MGIFLRAAALVLIAVVLGLVLSKNGKDISLLLTTAVCCMIVTAAMQYLQPVIDFMAKLESASVLDPEILQTLLKAVGIGLLAEIAGLICSDAGNASLGKTIQLLAAIVILWMSVPLLTQLVDLVENILGAI